MYCAERRGMRLMRSRRGLKPGDRRVVRAMVLFLMRRVWVRMACLSEVSESNRVFMVRLRE